MANSRKSNSADLPGRVAERIAPLVPVQGSILVGLSGGVDSVVLLHVLHRIAPQFAWKLSALHVHHGISPNADHWAGFCACLCASLSIPFRVERVDIGPLRDRGVEAAARQLRHEVLTRQPVDFIALAHHQDDQAETLLLQILRGAGVKGVAAMPLLKMRKDAPALLRPFLEVSRTELMQYAQACNLEWIEDESNADDSYPRNFLRHRVLPLLEQRFPATRATLARSAQHFAEASLLLDELARIDGVDGMEDGTLAVEVLRSLGRARAKNLLRFFLHGAGAPMPHALQLDDMLEQLCGARVDASVCISYGGWQVRRYLGRVYVLPDLGDLDRGIVLPWHHEAELYWPALKARLLFENMDEPRATDRPHLGIGLDKLRHAPVTLRLRHGREFLRPHPLAAKRSLKNLLQEQHIPPWQRERLPLLYCGDELVCVAGVAVAAGYQPDAGEQQIRLTIK